MNNVIQVNLSILDNILEQQNKVTVVEFIELIWEYDKISYSDMILKFWVSPSDFYINTILKDFI